MESLIFRNDDVNPSTDFYSLTKIYNVIKSVYPSSSIITGITLFSKHNVRGSVYGQVPFKDNPTNWFYDVDRFMNEIDYMTKDRIASHGLFHVDHSKLGKEAQEMSILSSCSFLKTDLFIPPFNKKNEYTEDICAENGIKLIDEIGQWKNFEYEDFDPRHKLWYFHSWRFTPDKLKEILYYGKLRKNGK